MSPQMPQPLILDSPGMTFEVPQHTTQPRPPATPSGQFAGEWYESRSHLREAQGRDPTTAPSPQANPRVRSGKPTARLRQRAPRPGSERTPRQQTQWPRPPLTEPSAPQSREPGTPRR